MLILLIIDIIWFFIAGIWLQSYRIIFIAFEYDLNLYTNLYMDALNPMCYFLLCFVLIPNQIYYNAQLCLVAILSSILILIMSLNIRVMKTVIIIHLIYSNILFILIQIHIIILLSPLMRYFESICFCILNHF